MRRMANAGIAPMPNERTPFRGILPHASGHRIRDQRALMRVDKRESFRETVFLCSTPFVIAR
jgi:hypothetical protein